jgi:hypothetical protein
MNTATSRETQIRGQVCAPRLYGYIAAALLAGALFLVVSSLASDAFAAQSPPIEGAAMRSQGEYSARNLVATVRVKAALRAAHLALLPRALRAGVRGPLKGTTYYGSYGRWR